MFAGYSEDSLMTLFSGDGERKYLNQKERKRFFKARKILKNKSERSFVEALFYTGCRISEALEITINRVNVHDNFIVFRTLKQHGDNKGQRFRILRVPPKFMKRLDHLHNIVEEQMNEPSDLTRRLWTFGRQKGWRLVKKVMSKAKIYGVKATPKGLRHTFGVNAIFVGTPIDKLRIWMGHQSVRTTAIYIHVIGAEDLAYAARTWKV